MEDGKSGNISQWYKCQCGVMFQDKQPKHSDYNMGYMKSLTGDKIKLNGIHAARTYVRLIEELTYGRMMLDVGFGISYNMEYFKDRGWLTWGIDNNKDLEPGGNIYKGDFISYDFSPNVSEEDMKKMLGTNVIDKRVFDLIWMSHVLEHFSDPCRAIRRAYDLLSESGVLYISTPDIDFIQKTGLSGYPHFKGNEHYLMWSEPALKREVERIGFKVIMSRRNFSTRFSAWYDIHLICQKVYF